MKEKIVYIIGTFDTKAPELQFAADTARSTGVRVRTVDISTTASAAQVDVPARQVAAHHVHGEHAVLEIKDRGQAVSAMTAALVNFLQKQKDVAGVLGLGGSGNTSMVTAAMQALPVGVPKVMVSTLAAGNVAPFVGASDIMMMHSVADIAGLNAITRTVIGNAAHAMAGMVLNTVAHVPTAKRTVGLTMFGVTTPAIMQIRNQIERDHECFVFHATGTGGQCLEKLIDSGYLASVIDFTTTEVADFLFGGILPCTDDRFGAIVRTGIPCVASVGAVDMVNFGPRGSVPSKYERRKFHVHNPAVTLMRTTPEENHQIGAWIVERINRMTGPTVFLLPMRGVSALDAEGQPFYDADADAALFAAVRNTWRAAPNRTLIEVEAHINDVAFAEAAVAAFRQVTRN